MFKHLLFLLHSHEGPLDFSWTKGHGSNEFNNIANFLANNSCVNGLPFQLNHLHTPHGWVDSSLVLNYQPLSFLTQAAVHHQVDPPLLSLQASPFADKWTYFM